MPIVILTAGQWLPLVVILPTSTGAQGTSVCLSACVCVCTSSTFPHVLLSGPAQLLFFFLFFSSLLLFFYWYRFSSGFSDLLSLYRIYCSSSLKTVSFIFKGHLDAGKPPRQPDKFWNWCEGESRLRGQKSADASV